MLFVSWNFEVGNQILNLMIIKRIISIAIWILRVSLENFVRRTSAKRKKKLIRPERLIKNQTKHPRSTKYPLRSMSSTRIRVYISLPLRDLLRHMVVLPLPNNYRNKSAAWKFSSTEGMDLLIVEIYLWPDYLRICSSN